MKQKGRGQEKGDRSVCPGRIRDCLWIEGRHNVAHRQMVVYKGEGGTSKLG